MIESVDEAVIVCDAGGRPVRMNQQAMRLFECDSVEHAWQSVSEVADAFELHTPEGSPIALEDRPLSRAIRGETFRDVEVCGRDTRAGNEWVFRCSGTPIKDPQGNVVLVVLILRKVEGTLETLRRKDPELGSVLRAAPLGIGLVVNRVILDVNDWFCEMVGYRREELVGHNSRMLYLAQEDWERVGRENYGQIHQRSKGAMEIRWRRKSGEIIDILLSSTLLDPRNPSCGVTFTALDITARKRAEDELRNIFSLSLDMICIADLRTDRLTKVNPAFERILGYSEQELLSRPFLEFVHPDDLNRAHEVLEEKLHQGERVVHFESRFRCKDGSYRWLDWTAHPQPEQGLTYGIARDVTEHKRLEEASRFTQFAVDHLSDGAAWLTEDARFCYLNDATCDLLGYSREEMMQLTLYDVDPNLTESIWTDFWRRLKADKSVVVEAIHRTKDGRLFPVEIRANYVEFGGRAYDCSFARDVTERKRAEEMLRKQGRQLQESERKLRTLMGNLPGIAYRCANEPDWPFEFVSEGSLALTGYEPREITVGGIVAYGDLIHPDDRQRVWDTVQEAGNRGAPFEMEYRIRTKDGVEKWVFERGRSVPSDAGGLPFLEGFITDITQRKHAEMALQESEERYRILLDHGFDGIFVHEGFEVVQVNDRLAEMTGYAPAELLGRNTLRLFTPDSQERIRRYVNSHENGYYELELQHRDGRVVQVESFGAPCRFQGRDARIVAVRDITERKRTAQTLAEKEYLLSESQRMGHIGSWSMDLTTGVLKWTRETYRLYGVSPDTFAPSPETLLDLLHPDDRGRMREWIRSALANEHPGAMEFRALLADGSTRILSGRGELILAEDGRPIRLVGTVQDITEEKEAELALRELGRKDEEALRVARMGHWEFDVATETFLFNDQYYTLHDMTAQEAGGYRMTAEEFARRYVHPEDAPLIFENVRKAVATNDPNFQLQREARILRSDGEVRWVTVWFRAEKDAEGRTIRLHGVNQDITERRAAEEAVRRLNEHLETLVAQRTEDLTRTVSRLQQLTWELSQTEDRERKRIADILHDDVQQILAAARFHLNLLSMETRTVEESREIIRQVKQMLKEAIEKARSLSHELSPALYQVDLVETMNWLARHMEEKHGLIVHVETRGPVESSCECVKALLYKVTQELLFNVVKHAGVKEALIRVQRKRRYICLGVIDRGRGFKPQELEKTAGFGLLGIRERIQLLGGRMKIKSTPGRGSRLLIAVPDEGPSLTIARAR